MIAIRGTLSAEDLITDFMCEPADMDDWMSTAATPHFGQGHGSHDPKGLVGSSEGHGFFSRHSSAQKRTTGVHPESLSRAVRHMHNDGMLRSVHRPTHNAQQQCSMSRAMSSS